MQRYLKTIKPPKTLILLIFTFVSFSSFASSYKIGLIELISPASIDDQYIVLATDGQVYEIDKENSELVKLAKIAIKSQSKILVKLSEHLDTEDLLQVRNKILSIKVLSKLKKKTPEFYSSAKPYDETILMSSYITNLSDENKVNDYFDSMDRKFRRRSECFNRAYVWSWEMSFNKYKGQRIHLGKAWIFFTRKYIRTYKYKWWFHIAPYINLNNEIRMLDRSFLKEPSTLQGWTDEFIYEKEECKVITKYTDYSEHQEERNCFVMKTSVHYWQPKDLEKAQTEGVAQDEWKDYRLKAAYRNAKGLFSKPPERD